jgi:hypothetical protein
VPAPAGDQPRNSDSARFHLMTPVDALAAQLPL